MPVKCEPKIGKSSKFVSILAVLNEKEFTETSSKFCGALAIAALTRKLPGPPCVTTFPSESTTARSSESTVQE